MINFYFLPIFAILSWCAYFDFKQKKIPDLAIALLWIVTFICARDSSYLAVGAFGVVYLLNTLMIKNGKAILGWGDVLIFPCFVVGTWMINHSLMYVGGMIALGFLLPVALAALSKRQLPVVPFMFLCWLIALFGTL